MKRIPDSFSCYHCNGIVKSYCLKCQYFVCERCIQYHAVHKSLRHCQQEAGNRRCQIVCKSCQNQGNISNAEYYSSSDKSFACKDCLKKRGQKDIIALNDLNWKCKLCEHNDDGIINPVECHCMVYDVKMCAVCFEEIRKQSLHRRNTIEARQNEEAKFCVLHSVLGLPVTQHFEQKNIRQISPDVYCLVCDEYLCTRCFFLHLNLKQLWQQLKFDKEFSNHAVTQVKLENHIEKLDKQKKEEERKKVPVKSIFAGCFPVFGIFVIIYMLCKRKNVTSVYKSHKGKKKKENKTELTEDKYCEFPSCFRYYGQKRPDNNHVI